MKKRVISSVLGGCMAASLIPSAAAAIPAEVKGTRYEEAAAVLSALKIMNGDENGQYRLDDTIIRSEVTKMAITAMGMAESANNSKETKFSDVSLTHWANGYINLASSLGLIEGDGDGKFRPNDPISYQEAATIMVRALGYDVQARNNGGYPSGYLKVANENKLTRNVEGGQTEAITRGNVAILTNNALEVNKMEQTGFGDGGKFEITNKTLLSDNLETEKLSGQILSAGDAALKDEKPAGKNRVKIGENEYAAATSLNNLLGYNVTYYVNKDKEVILALPDKGKNKTAEIASDRFSSVSEKNGKNVIEYYTDENSSKTTSLTLSNDAQLIYNNRLTDFKKDLIDISDKNAYLTVLDTNNDSSYDIVFVTEFSNIVIDYSTTDKAVGKNGETIRFDDIEYKLYNGFSEAEVSSLQEWDVLAKVSSLDNKYHEFYISRSIVSGKISSKSEDGVTIGDKTYKIANGMTDTLTIGQTADFCLDIDGKIAAIKAASNISDGYAYMTNIYKNDSRDNVLVKLTDKTGKVITLTLSDRVKLNGSTVSANEVYNELTENNSVKKQLITFSKNSSDKVTELNIANDKSESGAVDTEKFTLNKKLTNELYQSATSKLGNVRITDKTIVFDISDEDEIKVADKNVFENNETYTGMVYDMTESYDAAVIVLTDTAFKPAASSSLAVVKKIASGTNSEDNEIDILTALADGKEIVLNAKDNKTLKAGDRKLKAGDLIQYKTDSNGEIAGIRVLFNIDDKNVEFTSEPEKDLKLIYGKATKRFDNSLNVTVNDKNSVNYSVDSDVKVYNVDTAKSKNSITTASFTDISAYDSDENNRVFIKLYEDKVKEIVIVK